MKVDAFDLDIGGFVTITSGEDVICKDVHNHFTNNGMRGILSVPAYQGRTYSVIPTTAYAGFYLPAYNNEWSIYLGTDISNATDPATTTALVSPIGTAPGQAPSVNSVAARDGTSDGIWEAQYTALWVAGTISGTVGEAALYLKWPAATTGRWGDDATTLFNPPASLGARMAVADGDFTAFTIDTSKPTVVDWRLRFAFA